MREEAVKKRRKEADKREKYAAFNLDYDYYNTKTK